MILFFMSISLILEILSPANISSNQWIKLRFVLRIFHIIREEIIVKTFKTANTLIVPLLDFV
jgi:hypothetical protein